MAYETEDLYRASRILFRAFHHLLPRIRGGGIACSQPMNAEGLAACILHNCMGRLLRDLQQQRRFNNPASSNSGWIAIAGAEASRR